MGDEMRREDRDGLFRWRCCLLLLALGLVLSCASKGDRAPRDLSLEELLTKHGSRTVAILPFENASDEAEMAGLVRKTFYSHFSPKNYRDIELSRVDLLLESQAGAAGEDWRSLTPFELGALLRADFVIFGKVLNFRKIYLGIYSQIALTVGLEMVSCESGKGVWQKTLTKRSHDGGLPFSLFDVVPAALRSGLHMNHERTVGLVDQVARMLASEIPEPQVPPVSAGFAELQVASFLDPQRAENTIRLFEDRGMSGRIEPVTLKGRVYHRVFLGPFHMTADAEKARERIAGETEFRPVVILREGVPATGGNPSP